MISKETLDRILEQLEPEDRTPYDGLYTISHTIYGCSSLSRGGTYYDWANNHELAKAINDDKLQGVYERNDCPSAFSIVFNPKKMEYNYALTHALSFNGNIQPTKNWRFNFNATYDFDTHKISYMTCNITRDLHCWQMSASFVPIGPYKSYTFNIAVSSSLLKDLKWRQSSNYRDGQTWY